MNDNNISIEELICNDGVIFCSFYERYFIVYQTEELAVICNCPFCGLEV